MSSYTCIDPGFCSYVPAVLLFSSRKGNDKPIKMHSRFQRRSSLHSKAGCSSPALQAVAWEASPKPKQTEGTQVVGALWAAEGQGSFFQCRDLVWMTGAASSSMLGENQNPLMMSIVVWPCSWAHPKGRTEPALQLHPNTGWGSMARHVDTGPRIRSSRDGGGILHTETPSRPKRSSSSGCTSELSPTPGLGPRPATTFPKNWAAEDRGLFPVSILSENTLF